MPMTVVVTNNAPGRIRGFLTSCMCEIGPGIYTAPRMTRAVRERIWTVLEEWTAAFPFCSVLMTWPDPQRTGGQAIEVLGLPVTSIHDHNGLYLGRRKLDDAMEGTTCDIAATSAKRCTGREGNHATTLSDGERENEGG